MSSKTLNACLSLLLIANLETIIKLRKAYDVILSHSCPSCTYFYAFVLCNRSYSKSIETYLAGAELQLGFRIKLTHPHMVQLILPFHRVFTAVAKTTY